MHDNKNYVIGLHKLNACYKMAVCYYFHCVSLIVDHLYCLKKFGANNGLVLTENGVIKLCCKDQDLPL